MSGAGRDWSADARAWRAWLRSGGLQRLLAELAEGVEAALEQLARDRQAGAVAAQPLGGLFVVAAVGRSRAPRDLGRLVEGPAQRRAAPGGRDAPRCGGGPTRRR